MTPTASDLIQLMKHPFGSRLEKYRTNAPVTATVADLPGNFGLLISGKMAL
jgi:hypothetical protein